MITPPYLKKNDKIAIVATARKITHEELLPSVRIFESWGLEVITGKNTFNECHQFAGTDEERREDFQNALDDPSVKAVFLARGGYGNVRIIDSIDFSGFLRNPKWIAGFSDVTVIHSHIHQCLGVETLHSTMPYSMHYFPNEKTSSNSLRKALFGEDLIYSFQTDKLTVNGSAEGLLSGGNLSIIYSLTGSVSDIETDGKILFIEDIDEYLYHIDRMMINLKRSGKLSRLSGLIVGNMTDMKDNEVKFGNDAYGIIAEAVKEYNYPVWFGFPAGHSAVNLALILGRKVLMNVSETATLRFL